MKIYNVEKTQELDNPDLSLGYLKPDKLVAVLPEVQAVEEVSHYETIREYPNGGKDVEKVIDVPSVAYQPEREEIEEIQVYIPYTAEELQTIKDNAGKSARARYLDAYRKYQASINYGEYERVPEVDAFIKRLQDKDWAALESVPPALAYFAGECGFAESGLIKSSLI